MVNMNWKNLTELSQLDEIQTQSKQKTQLIFKHSTRCSISAMAKDRLERQWDVSELEVTTYYLDLIQFRNISSAIAEKWQVHHESPQVLLIKNETCVFDVSHNEISTHALKEQL